MVNRKLYYCEEQREFYWVKQTHKTIKVEWVEKLSCDGSELDQNVRYKILTIRKEKERRHCLNQNDECGILIYANQDGQPFFLEPANINHINKEIKSCEEWGVSSQYYKNLRIFT
jgi:hypothetical protein